MPSPVQVESTAHLIERMADDGQAIDWWQRGASAKARSAEDRDV
ncbi:hypothetical protein [Nocardia sp. CA-135398]